MIYRPEEHVERVHRRRVNALATLLVLGLFFVHTVLLFDIADLMVGSEQWIAEQFGEHRIGKVIILACFLVLFAMHIAEAAVWGIFLSRQRLLPSFSDGFYVAGVSISTLGYGDVVLPRPWRHLGPVISISGVLMFGCSTAFLFVLMQGMWTRHL